MGVAGGLVILWKKGLPSLNFSYRKEGYVGVNVFWKGGLTSLMCTLHVTYKLKGGCGEICWK